MIVWIVSFRTSAVFRCTVRSFSLHIGRARYNNEWLEKDTASGSSPSDTWTMYNQYNACHCQGRRVVTSGAFPIRKGGDKLRIRDWPQLGHGSKASLAFKVSLCCTPSHASGSELVALCIRT